MGLVLKPGPDTSDQVGCSDQLCWVSMGVCELETGARRGNALWVSQTLLHYLIDMRV